MIILSWKDEVAVVVRFIVGAVVFCVTVVDAAVDLLTVDAEVCLLKEEVARAFVELTILSVVPMVLTLVLLPLIC
jgi:hypothetical protein